MSVAVEYGDGTTFQSIFVFLFVGGENSKKPRESRALPKFSVETGGAGMSRIYGFVRYMKCDKCNGIAEEVLELVFQWSSTYNELHYRRGRTDGERT